VTLALIIIFVIVGSAAMWWLSGFDSQVTGEDKTQDLIRRVIRCLGTLALIGILFGPNAVGVGYAFAPLLIIIPAAIGVIWAGCIAELLSRGLRHVIDSDDKREFDPQEDARNLDELAHLLKSGQKEAALQVCAALRESGGISGHTLDTMLAHAGIPSNAVPLAKPLQDAGRARREGRFAEAESMLESLLAENPRNVEAAMMLMRLYAQDLRRTDKAMEVLKALRQQPHIPHAHIEYALRSIPEWSNPKAEPAPEVLPESVDELLAGGYLGSAIEVLERKVVERPEDFDSWLKLVEAHVVYSHNISRAQKILQQMENNRAFSPEQIAAAKAKFTEWRVAKPQR